jgi:hypothetical protein
LLTAIYRRGTSDKIITKPEHTDPQPPYPSLAYYQGREKDMSVTQIYLLAHTAQSKLSIEASRPDHYLRLLVGHSNLLNSLMIELTKAEQMQWLDCSVRGARAAEDPTSIQRADTMVEEPEVDWNLKSTLCYRGRKTSRTLDTI